MTKRKQKNSANIKLYFPAIDLDSTLQNNYWFMKISFQIMFIKWIALVIFSSYQFYACL